jgi:hypothetical protein
MILRLIYLTRIRSSTPNCLIFELGSKTTRVHGSGNLILFHERSLTRDCIRNPSNRKSNTVQIIS